MAKRKDVTITVTVIGWEKHNGKKKKGHSHFMLSSLFFDDPEVQKMTPSLAIAYLYVLTRCAHKCSKTVRMQLEHWRKNALSPREDYLKAARRLEKLRLLTIDSIDGPSLIEETSKEETSHDMNSRRGSRSPKAPPADKPPAPAKDSAGPVIAAYCDAWRARYQTDKSPTILPKDAASMKKLVQTVGAARAVVMVKAYLAMPDSWFVKKRHDIPTLMGNLNAITQFTDTGRMITNREANQLDLAATNQNTRDALNRGEI